jgi:hypothetical protein
MKKLRNMILILGTLAIHCACVTAQTAAMVMSKNSGVTLSTFVGEEFRAACHVVIDEYEASMRAKQQEG